MKILIFGGTRFLGRALVEAALERGDAVTMFNRGQTGTDLFPGIERIQGDRDRDGDLDRLAGRMWDVVFDTCGFVPRVVGASARALAGRVGHYTLVSSISVYAEPMILGADEAARVAKLADPATETVSGETYGALKALCEGAAEAELPGRVLNARAGLLVGPWDYTDRFPYWVERIARGGDVLMPDAMDQPVQFIDARDAAAWLLAMAERGEAGTFNLTGPATPLVLGGFFELARRVLNAQGVSFIPVAPEFLLEQGVTPWTELPLWTPGDEGHMAVSIARALARGLRLRPLEQTLLDTLKWITETGGPAPGGTTVAATSARASLSDERERALLAEWRDTKTPD